MAGRFSPDQKRTIATLSTAIAIRMLGVFLVLPVFTLYGEQFTSSKPLIGLAFGAFGLTNAVFQIPFGWLSDRFGRKPFLLIGLGLHSIGAILAAVPPNIFALIVARLIQGAGAISSVVFALVADSIEERHRATAMAFLGILIALSFVGGILAGPAIASVTGYASLFWLSGVLSLIAAIYIAIAVREPRRARTISAAPQRRSAASLLMAGDIVRLNLCGFLKSFFMSGFFFHFPLLARRHVPLRNYYLLLGPMLLVGGVVMLCASAAADRGWAKVTGVTAFVVLSLSGLLLFQGPEWGLQAHPLIVLTVAGMLFFAAYSSLEPILPSLVAKVSPKAQYGTALGGYTSLQFLGIFAGGTAAGVLGALGNQFMLVTLLMVAALGAWFMAQVRAA
ncbi:MAG: MFS transporter [Candidatus Methylomirabilaceae bacterium]